ncbi:MAG TPA: hypothetical protein VG319_08715 [Polyangia bacterium]|nr:hypothetical protein [Polyangia bacterium]
MALPRAQDVRRARHGRSRRGIVAAFLLLGPALAVAPRVPAKEHTAACPELAGMMARVRAGLQAASGQRLRGSSLGAYQVLRATAASMAHDSAGRRCGAVGPTLSVAVARADAAPTALDASLELDRGLDDVLSLATDGRLPQDVSPPKLLPVAEAALYGDGCPDLFPMTLRLDGPREGLRARVSAVLDDLRAHPRCAQIRRILERAAPERLGHAVDSIRLDEPDESDADSGLASRCPELPLVVDRLATAISVGAPQYNAGDAAACRHTYEVTASAIASQVIPEGRCPTVRTLLAAGLTRAKGAADDREAAWDLRHSFDAILSDEPGPSP